MSVVNVAGSTSVASQSLDVYVNETLTVPAGAAVCYDRTRTTVGERNYYVNRCTLANFNDLAGVVVSQGKHGITGPVRLGIVPLSSLERGVQVLTDENIAVGDYLAPIPGTFYWGKATIGRPLFRATQAVDGSTTPALVTGDFGLTVATEAELSSKRIDWFDHFNGQAGQGYAAADVSKWVLTGTSAAVTYADSFTPSDKTAAQAGLGVLNLTSNTTNQANLTMNGEPFSVGTGKSVFIQARIAVDDISADSDIFLGLHTNDTDYWGGSADQIGIRVVDGAIQLVFQKSTSGAVVVSTGVSLTANEFKTISILARNRAAAVGKKDLYIWVDGTLVSYTNNDTDRAEFPDTESLTIVAEAKGSAARVLRIDSLQVTNYIG